MIFYELMQYNQNTSIITKLLAQWEFWEIKNLYMIKIMPKYWSIACIKSGSDLISYRIEFWTNPIKMKSAISLLVCQKRKLSFERNLFSKPLFWLILNCWAILLYECFQLFNKSLVYVYIERNFNSQFG